MTTAGVETTTTGSTLGALVDIAVDLTASLSSEARYQRLLGALRRVVPYDAAALLAFRDGVLQPLAVEGLAPDVLGRCFDPEEHSRLAEVLEGREPVRFAADDPRPDPYDGMIEGTPDHMAHVHSCMGAPLYVGDRLVGALTVDAVAPDAFEHVDTATFEAFAALAAAAMRTALLIDTLEDLAEKRGQVARHLVRDALQRGGGELLGLSPLMRQLREEIGVVAASDLTVLVTGETGTGKELVARTLHARSPRAEQPLVYVNCAALPESIAESELFGHVRGAFTGAHADRMGKLELADGGTLFLDEVGELPLSLQPKLLRALQFGEIQRVGSERQRVVDVRVIAATNRDLVAEVEEGRFRPDLYHRLSVFPVSVPPLRDRREDIALLTGHFLDRARLDLGVGPVRVAPEALAELESYDWPGNVRELEHVVTRAALRASRSGDGRSVIIGSDHLDLRPMPGVPGASGSAGSAQAPSAAAPDLPDAGLSERVDAFRRAEIRRAVEQSGENWSEAARLLDMDKSNLHRLAKRLGLK
ncbi:MAG: nitric oxide reductase transcriptional regulator NorR [Myxococcota bacterium]